jgi:hypothetical protein
MSEVARCPKCGKSIDKTHEYAWCFSCGKQLPEEIKRLLPILIARAIVAGMPRVVLPSAPFENRRQRKRLMGKGHTPKSLVASRRQSAAEQENRVQASPQRQAAKGAVHWNTIAKQAPVLRTLIAKHNAQRPFDPATRPVGHAVGVKSIAAPATVQKIARKSASKRRGKQVPGWWHGGE